MLTLTDKIAKGLDNKSSSLYSKVRLQPWHLLKEMIKSRAFDCVDHPILLRKLYVYGISGTMHRQLPNPNDARCNYYRYKTTKETSIMEYDKS